MNGGKRVAKNHANAHPHTECEDQQENHQDRVVKDVLHEGPALVVDKEDRRLLHARREEHARVENVGLELGLDVRLVIAGEILPRQRSVVHQRRQVNRELACARSGTLLRRRCLSEALMGDLAIARRVVHTKQVGRRSLYEQA